MKPKRYSFTVLYAAYFAVYSLVVVLVLVLLGVLISTRLTQMHPTLEDFLRYQPALEQDQFSQIPLQRFRNCDFIVLDENQEIIYTSDDHLLQKFDAEDIQFINDYYTDSFYSVYQYDDAESGECRRLVIQQIRDQSHSEQFSKYCILDDDLNILSGNLFEGTHALTEVQYDLLSGTFHNNHMIQQYAYQTDDGADRTLIFFSPFFDFNEYDKNYAAAERLWLISIPVILLLIALLSILFARKLRSSIAPLNRAIVEYSRGNRVDLEQAKVPYEFQQVVENFEALLNQLEESKRETERANQARQRVLANLSHDIRTPLTVIQGYTRALNDGVVPENKRRQYIQVLHNRTEAMAELTEALQNYTQMELSDYPLNLVPTNICEYCRAYLADKYTELHLRHVELVADIPERDITLNLDQKLFKRLFENLLSNTLKNNTSGTTVTFRLEPLEGAVQLTIGDDGIGIPEELRPHIFEPFVSGNSARTSGSGSGLGLSIVHQITVLHGGTIILKNPPDRGFSTEFVITLPYQ